MNIELRQSASWLTDDGTRVTPIMVIRRWYKSDSNHGYPTIVQEWLQSWLSDDGTRVTPIVYFSPYTYLDYTTGYIDNVSTSYFYST